MRVMIELANSYVALDGSRRQWRYVDADRPTDPRCYDCGRAYKSFVDCSLANGIWEKINPTHHKGAGILCPNCIGDRLRAVGLAGVKARLW